MCGGQHEHGRGFRGFGFGRGGFPSREEWVERLQVYRDQLEAELDNVRDLMERLRDPGETPPEPAA
jgi:hypothetical protein